MTNHFKVSLVKSAIRIGACSLAMWYAAVGDIRISVVLFAFLFFVAEILGVFEEIVEDGKTPSHW